MNRKNISNMVAVPAPDAENPVSGRCRRNVALPARHRFSLVTRHDEQVWVNPPR